VSRWLVLAAGLVGSLAFALALAVLLELVDPVLLSPRQLEDIASLPVLGSLPRIV
jgi:capsular polysaccharide biosynthesis protein